MARAAWASFMVAKEKTATAQSDIAQLILCDLFFMARTVTHLDCGLNLSRVTRPLPAPQPSPGGVYHRTELDWPNE